MWDWLTVHQGGEEDVAFVNRTDDTGILTLAGPYARHVLSSVCDADLTDAGFPWLAAREFKVAGIPLLALRLSFTGELAWELHAPNDRLGELWDALMEAGAEHGIAPFGSAALNGLRLEKAYRGGHEIANDASPVHIDLMRFVNLDKPFVGREALMVRAERGERSKIAHP